MRRLFSWQRARPKDYFSSSHKYRYSYWKRVRNVGLSLYFLCKNYVKRDLCHFKALCKYYRKTETVTLMGEMSNIYCYYLKK
jgi:hypothetical protein